MQEKSQINENNLEVKKAVLRMVAPIEEKEVFFFVGENESQSFAVACPKGTLGTWHKKFAEKTTQN